MRIGIYTLFITPGQIGGIETYLRHLLVNLGKVDPINDYFIFVGSHNAYLFSDIVYPNFKQVVISLIPSPNSLGTRLLRRLKLQPSYITEQINRYQLDLLHYPGTTIDQLEIKTPCILTMHDIQQEYFPQFFSSPELQRRQATYRPSAEKARTIITGSEHTRQNIIEKYHLPSSKIKTIYYGVSDIFHLATTDEINQIRQKYNLPEEFIFFPANFWPHKNHARLFEALKLAWQKYGCSCQLVLSGVWQEKTSLQDLIAKMGVESAVSILGYLPYQDLPLIYSAATALVFPSLFEGFGLPVLEAMACDCPVICANSTSLPELVGEAAILIDPLDVAQLAEAIYNGCHSASLRRNLQEKGWQQVKKFSWQQSARQTVALYATPTPLSQL